MAGNKELKYKRTKEGNLFEVYYHGGGQLPDELTGRYNTERAVVEAIERYVNKRPVKRRYNGSSKDGKEL